MVFVETFLFLLSFLIGAWELFKVFTKVMLTLSWFNWRTRFQLFLKKSSRNGWLLNFSQSWDIILDLFGGEFEKNSGIWKNCGSWLDILDEMFPDIALVTSEFGILQKMLSIRVLLLLDILVGR